MESLQNKPSHGWDIPRISINTFGHWGDISAYNRTIEAYFKPTNWVHSPNAPLIQLGVSFDDLQGTIDDPNDYAQETRQNQSWIRRLALPQLFPRQLAEIQPRTYRLSTELGGVALTTIWQESIDRSDENYALPILFYNGVDIRHRPQIAE